MDAAHAAKRQRYAKRLGERLRTMSKGAIWRLAYQRGWQACWLRMKRAVA